MLEKLKATVLWLTALLIVFSGLLFALAACIVALVAALSPLLIPFLLVILLIKAIVV